MKRLLLLLAVLTAASLQAHADPIRPGALHRGKDLDANFDTDGLRITIFVDPKQDAMLMMQSVGGAGKAIFGGPSARFEPESFWRRVAEHFLEPVGCGVPEVGSIGNTFGHPFFWWASFQCPSGVDLRALLRSQHEALERGEPLRQQQP